MKDWVIRATEISKTYHLFKRPIDRLKHHMLGRFGYSHGSEFKALTEVSFEISRGEAFGIIGSNGAGKSTLLQIIAGTLQPTRGQVEKRGRIAALLELGSGFNPEFSGRENIRLNASILGFPESEISKLMENAISFSEIGEFIDQPVKTYSSGMVLRLAFSVMIHLKPDVLIVDEALAVGDISFVGKCLTKVAEFIRNGGTLLFVSHDTNMIKNLTKKVLFLDKGTVRFIGPTTEGIALYHSAIGERNQPGERFTHGSHQIEISQVDLTLTEDSHYKLRLEVKMNSVFPRPLKANFVIYNYLGLPMTGAEQQIPTDLSNIVVEFQNQKLRLSPGRYTVNVSIQPSDQSDFEIVSWWKNAASFEVRGETQFHLYEDDFTSEVRPSSPSGALPL